MRRGSVPGNEGSRHTRRGLRPDALDTLNGIPEEGEQEGRTFDLSNPLDAAKDAAKDAADLMSPEKKAQLDEALRALRAATVDAGAAPPVMVYA